MNRRSLIQSAAAIGLLALSGCATGMTSGTPNIVELAAGDDRFSTLVAAVTAAELAETLSGPGPFTVFAPTNEAFAALPAGTVDALLLPENKDQLIEVLTYHVVPGNYPASSLIGKRGSLTTVQGQALHVNGTDGVRIENSTVIVPDLAASNGTVHAIDTVLLP